MDADAMSKKNLFRSILNDFRIGKIDILVGTQMIAKGLDFPNVTLVGLVDADRSLHVEDFRASERTFQLIVQVSGRQVVVIERVRLWCKLVPSCFAYSLRTTNRFSGISNGNFGTKKRV